MSSPSSPDNTRRHWHGDPGARHEHLNAWTEPAGGPKAPAPRAAWALTPEMIAASQARRDSNTSTTDATSPTGSANSSSPPTVSERRRSSSSSGAGLFANLQTQKRQSADPGMVDRRASWNEQREKGGFFSKLWDGYTRGK